MKNLFKLFALALILFVSCDTGLNNNNNKKEEEPQEPKLLSFKVKGFWDYDNRYKTQTYTEAAEKLGTQDFVLKLGDFETLKRKDAIYITDYLTLDKQEIEYIWDYEADEGYEFDSSKIQVKKVENVTADLYSYLGNEEDIVRYFTSWFEERKEEMMYPEDLDSYAEVYEIASYFEKREITLEENEERTFWYINFYNNLKLKLYGTYYDDDDFAFVNFESWLATAEEIEEQIERNNLSVTLEDYFPVYQYLEKDEETDLFKVDENGRYIFKTEGVEQRYVTDIWYIPRCAKITFALDDCEAVCYVVF